MQTKSTEILVGGNGSNEPVKNNPTSKNLDAQVKPKNPRAIRRKFSTADKIKILEAFNNCDASDRGAFLRKEGFYYSSIIKWRSQLSENKSGLVKSKTEKWIFKHNQVLRENEKLRKKLLQAEAIIEIQKKVSKLLSDHVLDQEPSEV